SSQSARTRAVTLIARDVRKRPDHRSVGALLALWCVVQSSLLSRGYVVVDGQDGRVRAVAAVERVRQPEGLLAFGGGDHERHGVTRRPVLETEDLGDHGADVRGRVLQVIGELRSVPARRGGGRGTARDVVVA